MSQTFKHAQSEKIYNLREQVEKLHLAYATEANSLRARTQRYDARSQELQRSKNHDDQMLAMTLDGLANSAYDRSLDAEERAYKAQNDVPNICRDIAALANLADARLELHKALIANPTERGKKDALELDRRIMGVYERITESYDLPQPVADKLEKLYKPLVRQLGVDVEVEDKQKSEITN